MTRLIISVLVLLPLVWAAGTFTVTTAPGSPSGLTPPVVGANLAHFPTNQNAADWWSYLGPNNARVFMSPSSIEPIDDIPPYGDNVFTVAQFTSRKVAMRAAELANGAFTNDQYVMWSYFFQNYNLCCQSSDIWYFNYTFPTLHAMGVDIMVEASAAPTRFPINNSTDFGGMWEVWQNYYAQSYYLARTYGVTKWSLWNEPDLNGLAVGTWYPLFAAASDAVQAGVQDAATFLSNSKMTATIYGPTTAQNLCAYNGTVGVNGCTGIQNSVNTGNWGQTAVLNRHIRANGTIDPSYMALTSYDIHYYSPTGQMYVNYLTGLAALTAYDQGPKETPILVGMTEHNSNTAANYDLATQTLDDGSEYSALGVVVTDVVAAGVDHMYVFKFGQTARTASSTSTANYPVQKNGLLYANNTIGRYGGITQAGEVWRLFNIAAGQPGRKVYTCTGNLQAAYGFCMATFDPVTGNHYVYLVNGGSSIYQNMTLNVASLNLPANNFFTVREVSAVASGDIVQYGTVGAASIVNFPVQNPYSVHLVTLPGVAQSAASPATNAKLPTVNIIASSDGTTLGDGTLATSTSVNVTASGLYTVANALFTPNTRRVTQLKFPLPAASGAAAPVVQSAFLSLTTSTMSVALAQVQAHVYGLNSDSWSSTSATFASAAHLAQGVPACSAIMCNVVQGQGLNSNLTTIQGQLLATGGVWQEKVIDVTAFVRKRVAAGTGFASFVIAQDSRKDITTNGFTVVGQTSPGDVQADGLQIVAITNSPAGHGPQLWLVMAPANGVVPSLLEASTASATELAIELEEESGATAMVEDETYPTQDKPWSTSVLPWQHTASGKPNLNAAAPVPVHSKAAAVQALAKVDQDDEDEDEDD